MIVGLVISNRNISEKGIMGRGDKKCVCGERVGKTVHLLNCFKSSLENCRVKVKGSLLFSQLNVKHSRLAIHR